MKFRFNWESVSLFDKGRASYIAIHILQERVLNLKGVRSNARPQEGLEALTLNVDYSKTHSVTTIHTRLYPCTSHDAHSSYP